jgi:hypothetical protein
MKINKTKTQHNTICVGTPLYTREKTKTNKTKTQHNTICVRTPLYTNKHKQGKIRCHSKYLLFSKDMIYEQTAYYSVPILNQPNNYYIWQSVPITTDVVSSNLDRGEVYNIM